MKKPRDNPSIAEIRTRAWQRLAAAVPAAIKVLEKRKAKLEARIDVGKKLSSRERRELEKIRGTLRKVAISSHKAPLAADPPPPPAAQLPPGGEALGLTEAQANHAISVSETLGLATGVGDNSYVATRIFNQFSAMLLSGADSRSALFLLAELRPRNILEAMLITQMVGVYEASLIFLKNSTGDDQGDYRDQNVARSTRLMRLFMDQLEQLRRFRGATNQQKTVEHVHVNAGGQAIVGAVVPPPAALSSAEPTEKLLPRPAVKQKTDG